ncbi:GumC family protein [Zhongshania arctica]|uniref:GumC family protein n=1 Tax=Zhongshania arctica TaxID=3238302 RepID=A0ABV3TQS8_9GAMM
MNNQSNNQRPIVANQLDLAHIWEILNRAKWSILFLTIAVTMLAALAVLSVQPVFRATTTLLIEPTKNKIASAEELFGLDTSRGEYLSTQFALLESRELLKTVVTKTGLTEQPDFIMESKNTFNLGSLIRSLKLTEYLPFTMPSDIAPAAPPTLDEQMDFTLKVLQRQVTISPIAKTQLVRIHVDMANANIAARVADSIANNYISGQLDARLSMRETATSWMSERLIDLKDKLKNSERRLQLYREKENLVDIEGITTLSADTLSSISSRLTDARKELASSQSQFQQVRQIHRDDLERLSSVPAVLSNLGVQQFKAEQAKAISKVQELSRRYGPKHPTMISAQSELASANQSLRNQVSQVVSGIEKNYLLARSNEESLSSSYNNNRNEIKAIAKKEFTLRELQLDVDTNRSLYNTFLGRLKETSATTDMETANARVVDPAAVPSKPIKPKKALIVMLSALLALMAGAGITLLADALGNTFSSVQQIEDYLNLPVFGVVPFIKRKKRKALAKSFINTPKGVFAEAIRGLRTSTLLASNNDSQQLIYITSSVPGEGKSIIASNLALALGQLKETLLIDADMRQPVLGKSYDLPLGCPGLANILAGTATIEECLHEKDGIYIISAGAAPPNPLDLLSSPQFAEFIAQMRSRFDYVVIDTPPIQAVSDALVLAKNADILLQVVRSESTAKKVVESSIGQMLQNRLRVSGIVFSQVNDKKSKYYRYGKYHN